MKNIIVVKCRRLIPLAYLATQICIAVTVNELSLNLGLNLALIILTSAAYLLVCFKDPGYVELKGQKSKTLKQNNAGSLTQPQKLSDLIESSRSPGEDQAKSRESPQQRELQLGLQSKIDCEARVVEEKKYQNSSASSKRYNNLQLREDCIVQGQLGKALVVNQAQGFTPMPQKLKQVRRWCKQCDNQQVLRVRHCLDCKRCVAAFDHHCPWINNCVGEKNKFALVAFLFLQLIQLLGLAVDLGVNLSYNLQKESLFLEIVVIGLGLAVLGVLCFQIYLISINLTTWEYLRWNRIEYLMPFEQKKLISLFDQGLKINILTFLKANFIKQPMKWQQHINFEAGDCLIGGKTITERRLTVQLS